MGVFSKSNAPSASVKRNSFDLSFQNNLTMNFGTLYPCMCKEVLPGDTFDMDMAFGLRFMPMPFPIQTKIRCDAHFFYVRTRNLWENFPDFIGGHDDKGSIPSIGPAQKKQLTTGSLGDYLGIPTTLVYPDETSSPALDLKPSLVQAASNLWCYNPTQNPTEFQFTQITTVLPSPSTKITNTNKCYFTGFFQLANSNGSGNLSVQKGMIVRFYVPPFSSSANSSKFVAFILNSTFNNIRGFSGAYCTYKEDECYFEFTYNGTTPFTLKDIRLLVCPINTFSTNSSDIYDLQTLNPSFNLLYGSVLSNGVVDANVTDFNSISISALPFRAYESIYNSFYRDQRNNPYLIDGVECPNEYIPTKAGGEDPNVYSLRKRNWEQDFLTSALPSPQMGIAPLVGISSSGVATYQSEDGTAYKVKLNTAEDGDTVVGASVQSSVPNDVARSIINTATSGISINDFRAVNSLQRWLEANYRKGIKYRDQLQAHFGVTPDYAELDMPEFLGGCSEFVNISQINQTSESTSDSPLGSFAGQASAMGSSKHKIHRYFDEHGYVMCIISIVPVPCYSQLLPKHFTKFNTLDYYFPEFGHIGFQPIPYREVCPLQVLNDTDRHISLNDVFGYQRPWYDYLSSTDEVHGEFRTTLRDFVLYRLFGSIPSLNEKFLLVDQDQLNNVFSVNDTSDKILGQIHFRIHAKRPIPRYGIPRLE